MSIEQSWKQVPPEVGFWLTSRETALILGVSSQRLQGTGRSTTCIEADANVADGSSRKVRQNPKW
ncbi:hypothetical protein ABZ926_14275 [Streptomyces litmocidini]|uniref:hypothetical protein n=1 Tax=Streptomyces litmocidini TaxID=67318 RepID=UPI0033F9BCAF